MADYHEKLVLMLFENSILWPASSVGLTRTVLWNFAISQTAILPILTKVHFEKYQRLLGKVHWEDSGRRCSGNSQRLLFFKPDFHLALTNGMNGTSSEFGISEKVDDFAYQLFTLINSNRRSAWPSRGELNRAAPGNTTIHSNKEKSESPLLRLLTRIKISMIRMAEEIKVADRVETAETKLTQFHWTMP